MSISGSSEPRSNTTRRAVVQQELTDALALADGVAIAQVARLELLAPGDRLDPERLIASLKNSGKPAFYLPTAEAIVSELGNHVRAGEVVCVFSNGGFGGIHDKLLSKFGEKSAA